MFTVSSLAKKAGLPLFTVRHYTRIGLLKPARNSANGYRVYSRNDLDRLNFIASAKDLGFTLSEIEDILKNSEAGDSPCPMVRKVVEERVSANRKKIAELQKLQERLESAVKLWSHLENSEPDGHTVCRLIETFSENEINGA